MRAARQPLNLNTLLPALLPLAGKGAVHSHMHLPHPLRLLHQVRHLTNHKCTLHSHVCVCVCVCVCVHMGMVAVCGWEQERDSERGHARVCGQPAIIILTPLGVCCTCE